MAKSLFPPHTPSLANTARAGDSSRQSNQTKTLNGLARFGQIITIAIAQGGVLTLAVFWFLSSRQPNDEEGNVIFLSIGIGVFIINAIGSVVIPRMMRAAAVREYRKQAGVSPSTVSVGFSRWEQSDPDAVLPLEAAEFLQRNQSARIVSHALLEAAALLNSILLFLNGHPAHLLLAALAVAAIVAMVPTVDRLKRLLTAAESDMSIS